MPQSLNDNCAGIHHAVLAELDRTNILAECLELSPYGTDSVTEEANNAVRKFFPKAHKVLYLPTGTGANALGLSAFIDQTEIILCAKDAHINKHEAGAPLRFTSGASVLPLEACDGKLTIPMLEGHLSNQDSVGAFHRQRTRGVFISQATELGVVYSIAELQSISKFCRDNGLVLGVDGSRFFHAVDTVGYESVSIIEESSSFLTLSLSKNSGVFGSLLIIFDRNCDVEKLVCKQKQAGLLIDRTWAISAQANALFRDRLLLRLSSLANARARQIAKLLETYGWDLEFPVETNAIFLRLPEDVIARLKDKYAFYLWDRALGLVRFVFSATMSEEFIENFSEDLLNALTGNLDKLRTIAS